jgi:hypothetical protein
MFDAADRSGKHSICTAADYYTSFSRPATLSPNPNPNPNLNPNLMNYVDDGD